MDKGEKTKVKIAGKIEATIPAITAEMRGKSRLNFSQYHILSATHFTKLCYNVVQLYNEKPITEKAKAEYRSYSIGAIFSSVAFLESAINEFFVDVQNNPKGYDLPRLKIYKETCKILGLSVFGLKDKSILEKYDIAISLLKGQEIKRGFYPYQDVSYLIHIRNKLIHYKPEWDNKPEISVEIMKKYNKGFKLSPFVDKNTPFFLLKCLGHGCCRWS